MTEIRWRDGASTSPCLVCGSTDGRLIAEVDAHSLVGVRVERCDGCESLRLLGPMQDFTPDDAAIDDYIEGGAGLDAIALGLKRVRRDSVRRFLDIGCGYGFGAHMGQQLFGWEVLGIEPSPAGRRGQVELGVEIRDGLQDDEFETLGQFDLILASEVIEHVSEPLAFLRQLRRGLSPTGVVVLTTPAAEALARPLARQADAIQALSPGYHHFLASTPGLESLLERAGFTHFHVSREGLTLVALGARSSEGWSNVVPDPSVEPTELLRYFDSMAEMAPAGSALACGMASRHYRAAVMQGDFTVARRGAGRLRKALLGRHQIDIDDAAGAIAKLRSGHRPSWNLAGIAYSRGMLELLATSDAAAAARYFELAELSATAWGNLVGLLDCDGQNIRELSLGHRCLALAASDPQLATSATERLRTVLENDTGSDRLRLLWWKTRTFNELVAGGHLNEATALEGEIQDHLDDLVRHVDPSFRRAGLDALFLSGIRLLNSGLPTMSRSWFARCYEACDSMGPDDDHARELAWKARAHHEMAARRAGEGPEEITATRVDPDVIVGIDVFWCDAYGMYLAGYAHAGPLSVHTIALRHRAFRASQKPSLRQDVADLYRDYRVPPACGFGLYLSSRPGDYVDLELETDEGLRATRVQLPNHPLPEMEQPTARTRETMMRDFARRSEPGPILTLGRRALSGADVATLNQPFGDRAVINVDIHIGVNVDLVGDAHHLSRFFRPGSFAAVFSASVLEHLTAPWLVAAEINRILRMGGLVLHVAPLAWPEHASPNDFWRFTANALAVLFGEAAGFEVLERGDESHLRMYPDPSWRKDHLAMPTLGAPASSWVLARKIRELGDDEIRWPYEAAGGERLARSYPMDGLADHPL